MRFRKLGWLVSRHDGRAFAGLATEVEVLDSTIWKKGFRKTGEELMGREGAHAVEAEV